jgi:hypothetical protein
MNGGLRCANPPYALGSDLAMTYLTGYLRTEKGKHRLHSALSTIFMTFASVVTALNVRSGRDVLSWTPNTTWTLESALFDIELHMPLVEPVNWICLGQEPEQIELKLYAKQNQVGDIDLHKIEMKIIVPHLVEFYENSRPWLDANVSGGFARWPNVWQFGRIIRNAASHNLVRINDPNFRPVTWYGLTYGPTPHGQSIFEADWTFADLLILMFEMNDALDQLGCRI